jgi:flavin reductase (DIM6/NTAB) family NADH-FMN oxidoreductase RutF
MSVLRALQRAVRIRLLGETILPEEFATGIADPQQEVSVLLEGMGEPIDVTFRHSTACSAPFLIAIALDRGQTPTPVQLRRLSLKFYQRDEERCLLGGIDLRLQEILRVGDGHDLLLCAPRRVRNACLPRLSLAAQYSLEMLTQYRRRAATGIKMSILERHAAMVSFIRPHPTVLVSAKDQHGGNIFPMNIMGALGPGRIGFALRTDRLAGQLVERAGRLVMSNVPVTHAPLAYALARNHTRPFVDWDELPFSTRPSPMFQLPIPAFAQRARELEVEKSYRAGSHQFFVARIVKDSAFSLEPVLSIIHGYYQTWRLGGRAADMKAALVEDRVHKHGDAVLHS